MDTVLFNAKKDISGIQNPVNLADMQRFLQLFGKSLKDKI